MIDTLSNQHDANDAFTPDVLDDTYLNMELSLRRSCGEVEFACVLKGLRDKDGLLIGTPNDNPILDTRMYEVEFPDGHKAAMVANLIAEILFAQIDEGGNRFALFDDIVNCYRTNGQQVTIDNAAFVTATGTTCKKTTTAGWELLLQWKDNSTTWVTLKDTKDHYPVQVAEYAVAVGIANEPAFAWWWVPNTINKRNQIISKVINIGFKRTSLGLMGSNAQVWD